MSELTEETRDDPGRRAEEPGWPSAEVRQARTAWAKFQSNLLNEIRKAQSAVRSGGLTPILLEALWGGLLRIDVTADLVEVVDLEDGETVYSGPDKEGAAFFAVDLLQVKHELFHPSLVTVPLESAPPAEPAAIDRQDHAINEFLGSLAPELGTASCTEELHAWLRHVLEMGMGHRIEWNFDRSYTLPTFEGHTLKVVVLDEKFIEVSSVLEEGLHGLPDAPRHVQTLNRKNPRLKFVLFRGVLTVSRVVRAVPFVKELVTEEIHEFMHSRDSIKGIGEQMRTLDARARARNPLPPRGPRPVGRTQHVVRDLTERIERLERGQKLGETEDDQEGGARDD